MNIRVEEVVTVRLDVGDVERLKVTGVLTQRFEVQNVPLLNVAVERNQRSSARYFDAERHLKIELSDYDLCRLENPEYMKNGLNFDGVCIQFDIRRAK